MSCPSWLGHVEINPFRRCSFAAIHLINLHVNIMLLLRGASLLMLSWKAETFSWLMRHVPKHSRERQNDGELARKGENRGSSLKCYTQTQPQPLEDLEKHDVSKAHSWLSVGLPGFIATHTYVLKKGRIQVPFFALQNCDFMCFQSTFTSCLQKMNVCCTCISTSIFSKS